MGIAQQLRAFGKATDIILRKLLPPEPGMEDLAAAVGHVDYAGIPFGALTPDFIGQQCQDTTTGVFWKAHGSTSYSWEPVNAKRLARRGNVATRIFHGRMGTFDNSTVKSFQMTLELAQKFDAVRLIFANGNSGSTIAVGVTKVGTPDAGTDINNAAGSAWTSVTFGGSATGTVPVAPGTDRRGYLLSDWIEINSAARSDGGTYPILCVRTYITSAATITIMGNGSDSFTNWATRTPRFLAMRYENGDKVTTPSGWTSTTNRDQCPIIGVQYACRGRVITVMGVGDSIIDGRGTYLGEGFGVLACESLSSMSGVAYEWANLGWAGKDSPVFRDGVIDVLAAGIYPDIMVLPIMSPNDTGATIGSTTVNTARKASIRALAEMRAYQVTPILHTFLPVNPTVKNWDATDSLRTAYNADVLTWVNRGIAVADLATAISGSTDSDGQINILTGASTDGIHPNDTGNAIEYPVLKAEIAKHW